MAIAVTRAVDMTDSENVWSSISGPFEKAENTDTLFSNEVDACDLEWDDGLDVDAFICDKIFLQHSSRVLEFQCMLRLLLKLTVICLHGLHGHSCHHFRIRVDLLILSLERHVDLSTYYFSWSLYLFI